MKKRAISLLLTCAILISVLPVTSLAAPVDFVARVVATSVASATPTVQLEITTGASHAGGVSGASADVFAWVCTEKQFTSVDDEGGGNIFEGDATLIDFENSQFLNPDKLVNDDKTDNTTDAVGGKEKFKIEKETTTQIDITGLKGGYKYAAIVWSTNGVDERLVYNFELAPDGSIAVAASTDPTGTATITLAAVGGTVTGTDVTTGSTNVTLTADTTGVTFPNSGTPSYKWYKGATLISSTEGYTGETTNVLAITKYDNTFAGDYKCEVYNNETGLGVSTKSVDATQTVTTKKANPVVTLTAKTTSYNGSAQGVAAPTVQVDSADVEAGAITYSYIQTKNGSGATDTTYNAATPPANAGTYNVTATVAGNDDYETATSAEVELVIAQDKPTTFTATDIATGVYENVEFEIAGNTTIAIGNSEGADISAHYDIAYAGTGIANGKLTATSTADVSATAALTVKPADANNYALPATNVAAFTIKVTPATSNDLALTSNAAVTIQYGNKETIVTSGGNAEKITYTSDNADVTISDTGVITANNYTGTAKITISQPAKAGTPPSAGATLTDAVTVTLAPRVATVGAGDFAVIAKDYDKSTTATVTGALAVTNIVNSDVVTITGTTAAYADSNAGNNKTMTLSGSTLAGAKAAYYTLAGATMPAIKGDIKKATIATAPTLSAPTSKTATEIVLTAPTGAPTGAGAVEYSKDGGANWQASTTFTGLAAATEYTFVARWTADASGNYLPSAKSAEYKVTTENTPTYTFTLGKKVDGFPTNSVFGYTAPTAETITITNTGNQELTGVNVAATDADSAFTLGALSSTTIAVGGTATFTVTPKAGLNAKTGAYTATYAVSATSATTAGTDATFTATFEVAKATLAAPVAPTEHATTKPTAEEITLATITAPTGGTIEYACVEMPTNVTGKTSGIFTGLTAGTAYTFTAIAKAANGNYADSAASAASAPISTLAAPTYTFTLDKNADNFATNSVFGYTAPTAETITITNTGNQELTGVNVAATDADSAFTLGALSSTTIAVGGTAKFTVTPKAGLDAKTGAYTATYVVSATSATTADADATFTATFEVAKATLTTPVVPTVGTPAPTATTITLATITAPTGGTIEYACVEMPANVTGKTTGIFTGLTAGTAYTFTAKAIADASGNYADSVASAASAKIKTLDAPTYTIVAKTVPIFTDITFGAAQPAAQDVVFTNSGNQAQTITATLEGADKDKFVLTGTATNIAASADATFSIQPNAGLAAGTYTVQVKAISDNNATGATTANITFTVTQKELTDVDITGTLTFADQAYNGKGKTDITGAVTGTFTAPAGVALGTIEYTRANSNKGDAVVVTAKITSITSTNYKLPAGGITIANAGTVKVTPITIAYSAAITKTYDGKVELTGSQKTAIESAAIAEKIVGDDVSIDATSAVYASADVATGIVISGVVLAGAESANYTLDALTGAITKAKPAITITSPTANQEVVSGTVLSTIAIVGTHKDAAGAEVPGVLTWTTGTATIENGKVEHEWTFTPTATANYETVKGNITFRIKGVEATTIEPFPTGVVYDGTEHDLPVPVVKAGANTVAASDYTAAWTGGATKYTNAGEYTCTITMKNQNAYSNPAPIVFTVAKAKITGALNATKSYDGNANMTLAQIAAKELNGVNGEKFTLSTLTGAMYSEADVHATTAAANKGTIAVTPVGGALAANYDVTDVTGITINGAITAAPIAGKPTITGKPIFGETLTASVAGVTPAGATLAYQWKADDAEIAGATNATLVLAADQVGKTITVEVTASGNYSGSAESAATAVVTKKSITGAVSITDKNAGTLVVGDVLAADLSGVIPVDAQSSTYTYSWKNGSTEVGTTAEYTVKAGDTSITLTITVDSADVRFDGFLTSAAVEPGKTALVSVGIPTSDNGTVWGSILTAGAIDPIGAQTEVDYQWMSNGTNVGTNSSSYTTVIGDVGKTITVKITPKATSTAYSGSATSLAFGPMTNQAQTAPSPTTTVGGPYYDKVVVNTVVGQEYLINTANDVTTNSPAWIVATGTTHEFTGLTAGTPYYVFTRLAAKTGYDASPASSSATQTTKTLAVPGAPENLVVTAGNKTLTVSWKAPTDDGGSAITKYTVQLNAESAIEVTSGTTHTFTDLANDTLYNITVAAVNAQGTGANATGSGTPKAQSGGGTSDTSPAPTPTEFVVSFEAGTNGKITSGETKVSVKADAMVEKTPTVVAADGFAFKGWSIDGKTVVDPKTVKITKATTFTALYEIDDLFFNKSLKGSYIEGYEDSTFGPQKPITRAEVAGIIARTLSKQMEEGKTYATNFADVDSSKWYANSVGFLAELGVIDGYEDGTFRPNSNISRAEFISMVIKVDGLVSGTNSFSDVDTSVWYAEYITSAAAKNIVNGYADGTFRPTQNITRAEVVKIINVVLARTAEKGEMKFTDVDSTHWAHDEIVAAAK